VANKQRRYISQIASNWISGCLQRMRWDGAKTRNP
jgi:hypothetical protein